MRWLFAPDDSDAFEQSNEVRIRRADAWAAERRRVFDPDTVREALVFRHDSRDGRLGYWTPELVRRFLLEIVPERFTGDIETYAHVPEALRTWLRFLDHAGALHPHGSDLAELEAAVDDSAAAFPAAFTDPANWGPARIAAQAALASGIDLATPAGVERFNAVMGSADHDSEAMAAAVARQAERRTRSYRLPALPALELPRPERTAALAADAEAVRGAVAFLDWLGEGRALTQKGNLRKGDAAALAELLGTGDDTDSFTSASELPGLNWYLELLLESGLVRRVKQRLVPVAKNARLARDPLALLLAAWGTEAAWRYRDPRMFARPGGSGFEPRMFVEALLGTAAGVPIPVAEVRSRIARAVFGEAPDPEDFRGLLASMTLHVRVDHVLTAMRRFGAVEFDGPWDLDEGTSGENEDVSVALTGLGSHLLWTAWRRRGLEAPAVGDLTGCSAAVMLVTVADRYGQEAGVEEIRRWLAAHGDDPALLLEAVAANPFRTGQSAMLGAAADAVGPHLLDRARADVRLRPIAVMLLSLRGRIDLNAMMEGTAAEREEAALGLAEQVLESVEHLGPEGFAESVRDLPPGSREGMLALIAETGHPDRWLVDLFTAEVAPRLAGAGDRRRQSLQAARDRSKHARRRRRPKRRR